MNKFQSDINDDEIRIISSDSTCRGIDDGDGLKRLPVSENRNNDGRRKRYLAILLVALSILLLAFIGYLLFSSAYDTDDDFEDVVACQIFENEEITTEQEDEVVVAPVGYVEVTDTIVNKVPLTVFTPRHAKPVLHIGADVLNDSSAVLVVQAADIRRDNGEIVGTYVSEGKLISRGASKAGFCAIIGGKPMIGVADATPYFEQAFESGGYFFRQYPLVVGNQIIENKPQNRSFRKALAEWNGDIVVIVSGSRQSFHDFSQSLVDMGVSNAIYLVGSAAYGFARDKDNNRIDFGKKSDSSPVYTNYMVWR